MRHDRLSKHFVQHLGKMHGLERLYLINPRHIPMMPNGHTGPSPQSAPTPATTPSDASSNNVFNNRTVPKTSIRDACIDTIISNHGSTLKHLILPDRWPMSNAMVGRLFRNCPNITQLALAPEIASFSGMRMLLPFLKQIRAVRLLIPTTGDIAQQQKFASLVEEEDDVHEEHIGRETAEDFPNLRYMGLGWKVWELGGHFEKVFKVKNEDGVDEERVSRTRRCKRVDRGVVRDVEIWKMDSLDVI